MTPFKPLKKLSTVFSYAVTLDERSYFESEVRNKEGAVLWSLHTHSATALKEGGFVTDLSDPEQIEAYLKSTGTLSREATLECPMVAQSKWTEEDTVKFQLTNFHGFYESVHDRCIDDAINQLFSDDSGNVMIPDNFWGQYGMTSELMSAYSNEYAECFSDYIKDEKEFSVPSMKFDSAWSPREYNFTTDKITVSANSKDLEEAISLWMKNTTIDDMIFAREYVSDRLATRSGFHSFHDDVVARSKASDNIFEWFGAPLSECDAAVSGVIIGSLLGEMDEEAILNVSSRYPFHDVASDLVYKHLPKECKAMADAFYKEHYDTDVSASM